jgi:diguanylate cyclase (GGDEF)-like protein
LPVSSVCPETLSSLITSAVKRWGSIKRSVTSRRKLETMASTDNVTGLFNRQSLVGKLKEFVAQSKRYGDKLTLLMMDIDDFKKFNDVYGHKTGDKILKRVAQVMKNNLRDADIVGRWGGDEFLAILSHTDEDSAQLPAERVRQGVAALIFKDRGRKPYGVTLSIGIVAYSTEEKAGSFINLADNMLYEAKNRGKNQIFCLEKVKISTR